MQMITIQPTDQNQMPDQGNHVKYASTKVNLLQVDFAVKDERTITSWVWGMIMYAGKSRDKEKQVSITQFWRFISALICNPSRDIKASFP